MCKGSCHRQVTEGLSFAHNPSASFHSPPPLTQGRLVGKLLDISSLPRYKGSQGGPAVRSLDCARDDIAFPQGSAPADGPRDGRPDPRKIHLPLPVGAGFPRPQNAACLTFPPTTDIIKRQRAGQPRRGDPVRKVRASQSRITDNVGRGRPPDKCNRNRPPRFAR